MVGLTFLQRIVAREASMARGKRRPAAFWEPLAAEWKSSGLSAGRFAVSKGVAPNTFAYWVSRSSVADEQRLVPVELVSGGGGTFEVALRGGVVRLPVGVSAAWVAERLVRAEPG